MSARARVGFGVGAALGLALAGGAILEPPGIVEPPDDAVAVVNGVPIDRARFDRAIEALASDRRSPPDRQVVIERLIDEELLVQRALALELDRYDRTVRARLVESMIEAIVAEGASDEPDRDEVEAFYRENAAFFTPGDRFDVRVLRVDRENPGARSVASQAAERLRAGEDFELVAREVGSAPVAPVPAGPLPLGKLREYVGPSVAERVSELAAGDVSEPIPSESAFSVVQVVERRRGAPPPFSEIEDEARREIRRRRDDRALREYLNRLREEAAIRIRDA